jgi:hypothetical protein
MSKPEEVVDTATLVDALLEAGRIRASGHHYSTSGKLALLNAYMRINQLYPQARKAGMTSVHIAELVGVSRPQLWRIRQGQTEVQMDTDLTELAAMRAGNS